MKKFLLAALAALTIAAAAAPASAQDYRGGRGDDGYRGGANYRDGDYRRSAPITIRDGRRQFTVQRGDRMFYRLLDSPFRFRPGLTYVYTNDCRRGECRVLVFAPNARAPISSLRAPRIGDRRGGWDDRGGRGDDRYDGRDGRDGQWNDDGRDGNGRWDDNSHDGRIENRPH